VVTIGSTIDWGRALTVMVSGGYELVERSIEFVAVNVYVVVVAGHTLVEPDAGSTDPMDVMFPVVAPDELHVNVAHPPANRSVLSAERKTFFGASGGWITLTVVEAVVVPAPVAGRMYEVVKLGQTSTELPETTPTFVIDTEVTYCALQDRVVHVDFGSLVLWTGLTLEVKSDTTGAGGSAFPGALIGAESQTEPFPDFSIMTCGLTARRNGWPVISMRSRKSDGNPLLVAFTFTTQYLLSPVPSFVPESPIPGANSSHEFELQLFVPAGAMYTRTFEVFNENSAGISRSTLLMLELPVLKE
jgi:hypothetical protein